jgi:hypothetical protein
MSERAAAVVARVVLLAGVLGVLALRWPAVPGGYQDDDYIQHAMLEGEFWIQRGPLDLFWFGGRDASEQRALIEHGYHPWWTHPQHRVAMLRPFASGLLALEHALGLSPQAQHVVALALFALCVWAAHRFLRSVLPPWIAVVATLLYALDEAHGAPTSWLANRSTLISTALALIALTSYVRARTEAPERIFAGTRAFALLLLAMLSGEYAYFVLGYIAAFELLQARKASLPSLAIAGGLLALVAGAGALLGYRIQYSGFYISPFGDPARFAQAALARLPALLLELISGIPARYVDAGIPLREPLLARGWVDAVTWYHLPSYRTVATIVVWPALFALYRSVRALIRRDEALRPLAWLVLGACFALLPAAGALPSSRLLGGSAVGIAALLGTLITRGLEHLRRPAWSRAPRALASAAGLFAIAFVHGLLPADRAYKEGLYATERSRTARRWALKADIPKDLPPDAQVWLISASDFSTAVHVPWARWHAGLPRIERFRLLSGASRAHDLIRIDDRTLELQILSSDPGNAFAGSLYRPFDAPLHVGERIVLPGFTAQIVETVAGDPLRVRFSADRSLDDPSIVLLCPDPSGLRRCAMPAQGFVLRVPRAPVPWGNPNQPFTKTVRPVH